MVFPFLLIPFETEYIDLTIKITMKRILSKLLSRLSVLIFFLRGDISFSRFIWAVVPYRWRGEEPLRKLPEEKDLPKLYGHPFNTLGDMVDFACLRLQIIILNQYHVELIKTNDVVIDAGANVGTFSILAAVKHPGATIYAFEPTPRYFRSVKTEHKALSQHQSIQLCAREH